MSPWQYNIFLIFFLSSTHRKSSLASIPVACTLMFSRTTLLCLSFLVVFLGYFLIPSLPTALPNRKEALMMSCWPQTSLPRLSNSIKRFENLQALMRAIRNAQTEYSVEPIKHISASIVANSEVIDYISEEKEVLALLSRLDLQNLHFADYPPSDANQSVHLVAGEGLEACLPLADMVDVSTEIERLTKRISKMQAEYDALAARLSSPKLKIRGSRPLGESVFYLLRNGTSKREEESLIKN